MQINPSIQMCIIHKKKRRNIEIWIKPYFLMNNLNQNSLRWNLMTKCYGKIDKSQSLLNVTIPGESVQNTPQWNKIKMFSSITNQSLSSHGQSRAYRKFFF